MTPFLIESTRRVLTALLMLVGTVCFWFLDGPWPTVQLVDFEVDLKNSPYFVPKGTTVERFREQRTKDRTVQTGSDTWYLLAQQLRTDTLPGALHRMDLGRGRAAWVLPSWALPPVADGAFLDYQRGVYVNLTGTDTWLWVQARTAREIGNLPGSMKFPLRLHASALFLAAILVYTLLPRRRPHADALTYGRASAVVIPDWLGFVMSAFFITFPVLAFNDNRGSFEGGWLWFTGFMALMSFLFLSLPAISIFYTTWSLRILDHGLALTRWGRESTLNWEKITTARPYRGKANWVIGLLLIFAARGPGMAGQGLLVMSNQEQGVEFKLSDGKRVRIMANSLRGFEQLIDALKQRNLADGFSK